MPRWARRRALAGPLLAAGCLLAAFGAVPVRAQQPAAPIIVTVDVTQILRDAKGAKDIQTQIDKQTEAYTKEVSAQENELQRMRDELERQRTLLSTDAFNAKTREYQKRFEALDSGVQGRRQALQQTYNEAMTKVENTALQIIADIAAQRKANLVLTKAAVLFEAPGLDITAEVIKQLDAKLPSMPLVLSSGATPAAPATSPAATPVKK